VEKNYILVAGICWLLAGAMLAIAYPSLFNLPILYPEERDFLQRIPMMIAFFILLPIAYPMIQVLRGNSQSEVEIKDEAISSNQPITAEDIIKLYETPDVQDFYPGTREGRPSKPLKLTEGHKKYLRNLTPQDIKELFELGIYEAWPAPRDWPVPPDLSHLSNEEAWEEFRLSYIMTVKPEYYYSINFKTYMGMRSLFD
jgi:hypothetical protein